MDLISTLEPDLELPPLPEARYAECVELYEARSDQRRKLLGWADEHLIATLPQDLASVLSVGCGSGAFDRPLLSAVMSHATQARYVGVDPNPHQCASFVAELEALGDEGAEVQVHVAPLRQAPLAGRFDLVHLTHSLYYMPEPEHALRMALRRVAPGGRLVVLLAPNEALNAIADRCWRRQHGGRPAWFSHDVADFLGSEQIPFERTRIAAQLDATPLLAPGGLDDPEGRGLLDFIAQADTRRLPAGAAEGLRGFLDSIATSEGDRHLLEHPVEAIVVRR